MLYIVLGLAMIVLLFAGVIASCRLGTSSCSWRDAMNDVGFLLLVCLWTAAAEALIFYGIYK